LEQEESKPYEQEKWESDGDEKVLICHPTQVNDIHCKHEFEFVYKDPEGLNVYRCKKCPVGRRVNGRL
jgi:hypothetical protein